MRRLFASLLAIVLWGAAATARADLYGYVDGAGLTHLATGKLDDRYALFVKGDFARAMPAGGAGEGALPPGSRLFQRLVGAPNVARYEPMIRAAAARHGLDPDLVKAVVAVESGFEPSAVSDKGAIGLMQILPATAERYGVRADRRRSVEQKLADPVVNLDVGARYLADLRHRFAARPELALAAYNAGENAVVRHRDTIPPYPETRSYVKLVGQMHAFYRPAPTATATVAEARGRLKVMLPARRNLSDRNAAQRLPATAAPVVPVEPLAREARTTDAGDAS